MRCIPPSIVAACGSLALLAIGCGNGSSGGNPGTGGSTSGAAGT